MKSFEKKLILLLLFGMAISPLIDSLIFGENYEYFIFSTVVEGICAVSGYLMGKYLNNRM